MQDNVIFHDSATRSSYVIRADAVAETPYVVKAKAVSRQTVLDALGDFVKVTVDSLRTARASAKQELKHL